MSQASLAAIEGHETGDHWFLSGYALEDFAGRFIERMPAKPASVKLAPSSDSANSQYLQDVAESLHHRARLTLSPFERIAESAPVTVLNEVQIGESEIKPYEHWTQEHPDSVTYLYGAVDLAATEAHHSSPWKRAFRQVLGQPKEIGSPLVLLRAGRSPLAKSSSEIALFSWCPVWLSDSSFNRLVALIEAVVQTSEERIVSSWLSLEGGAFKAREADLNKALSAYFRDVQ